MAPELQTLGRQKRRIRACHQMHTIKLKMHMLKLEMHTPELGKPENDVNLTQYPYKKLHGRVFNHGIDKRLAKESSRVRATVFDVSESLFTSRPSGRAERSPKTSKVQQRDKSRALLE